MPEYNIDDLGGLTGLKIKLYANELELPCTVRVGKATFKLRKKLLQGLMLGLLLAADWNEYEKESDK